MEFYLRHLGKVALCSKPFSGTQKVGKFSNLCSFPGSQGSGTS